MFNLCSQSPVLREIEVRVPGHTTVQSRMQFRDLLSVWVCEWHGRVCYQMQVHVSDAQWGQTILKRQTLEQRKVYYRAMQGEWVAHASKTLNSLKGFSKAFLKARWGRGVVGCCKPLGVGILCSRSCPHRSGHNVPVNLQQDKCYSLFCNFLPLYEWKSVIPLKVRGLRMGYPIYFRL